MKSAWGTDAPRHVREGPFKLVGCNDESIKLVVLFERYMFSFTGWLYAAPDFARESKERIVGGLIVFCGA